MEVETLPVESSVRPAAVAGPMGWVESLAKRVMISPGETEPVVFVPGVNEGLFPRPPAEDPLLLQAQRQSLGVELCAALQTEDTELLRIAAACASEQFTLSFSRLDLLTGRLRVPSFYAFAVRSDERR